MRIAGNENNSLLISMYMLTLVSVMKTCMKSAFNITSYRHNISKQGKDSEVMKVIDMFSRLSYKTEMKICSSRQWMRASICSLLTTKTKRNKDLVLAELQIML